MPLAVFFSSAFSLALNRQNLAKNAWNTYWITHLLVCVLRVEICSTINPIESDFLCSFSSNVHTHCAWKMKSNERWINKIIKRQNCVDSEMVEKVLWAFYGIHITLHIICSNFLCRQTRIGLERSAWEANISAEKHITVINIFSPSSSFSRMVFLSARPTLKRRGIASNWSHSHAASYALAWSEDDEWKYMRAAEAPFGHHQLVAHGHSQCAYCVSLEATQFLLSVLRSNVPRWILMPSFLLLSS